jgi:hypothetical protein
MVKNFPKGHLLYQAAGGPFCLRTSMATSTNERVVEVRAARVAGMTGELEDYNILASMLPQDTRVCDARYCCTYHLHVWLCY